ncbi:hypothetical protein IVB22_30830 [Bradyrhizobium sp. 190]|uniref:hypothetical protein n=1 Tax=Bradyrhizobium sp. 190 TaxID=2782658 RepID=UPI001FF8DF6F|nr:hypothetical protein [Bradyrhizobium sp. 190]MCK1516827.1 hypothetical protein [Bradyrhizobium sp. 190]
MRDDAFVMTHWKRPSRRAAVDGQMGRLMKNRSFPGEDDAALAYEISGALRVDSDRTLFARNTLMHLQAEGQAAPVWIAAAVAVMTWPSQPQAFPDQARYAAADEQHAMKSSHGGATSVVQGFRHRGIGSAYKAWKGIG